MHARYVSVPSRRWLLPPSGQDRRLVKGHGVYGSLGAVENIHLCGRSLYETAAPGSRTRTRGRNPPI